MNLRSFKKSILYECSKEYIKQRVLIATTTTTISKKDTLKSKIDHFEIIAKQLLEYGSEEADNLDTNMFHTIRRLLLVDRWEEATEGTLLTHLPPEIQQSFTIGIINNFLAHV